ncbi:MAG: hypothetical protein VKI63_06000 [Cyanobium sp.]|nr:hypothetical protein [Cyanobium sp.]
MHCPVEGCCGSLETLGVTQTPLRTRRRRRCLNCGYRFITHEFIAEGPHRAAGETELARALVALAHHAPVEGVASWVDMPVDRIKALRRELIQARKDFAPFLPFLAKPSPADPDEPSVP